MIQWLWWFLLPGLFVIVTLGSILLHECFGVGSFVGDISQGITENDPTLIAAAPFVLLAFSIWVSWAHFKARRCPACSKWWGGVRTSSVDAGSTNQLEGGFEDGSWVMRRETVIRQNWTLVCRKCGHVWERGWVSRTRK